MSIKEANRLSVMRQIDKKILGLRKASEELGVSLRQTKRIRKNYLQKGELGLISKHRGKRSANAIDSNKKKSMLEILRGQEYRGFGPTLAREKLEERHGYRASDETVRKWMMEEGLWEGKSRRKRKVHQRRKRRSRFGELIQGDGSRHAWFEERGEECTLVIFVDDATSQLTAGRFVEAESIEAYQAILEEHLKKYGKPLGLYVDKHSIFMTSRDEGRFKETETHFGRVLRELEIELICAHSPQAKGRVERANGTLQDRLIKEMRLRGISSREEGNRYLPEFIREHNKRFGKLPGDAEDAHRKFTEAEELDKIFARRSIRKVAKDLSFSYKGKIYQLQPRMKNRFRSTHVTVFEREGKGITIESNGKDCPYILYEEIAYTKPEIVDSKGIEALWPTRKQWKRRRHVWNR